MCSQTARQRVRRDVADAAEPVRAGPRARPGRRHARALRRARHAATRRSRRSPKAVGIARGLIYRQFSSKEELFVLTVTDYLDELAGAARRRRSPAGAEPVDRLEAGHPSLRGVLRALPGVPRLLRCRSCSARRATCTRSSPSPSGCASGRAWRAASTSSIVVLRDGARARVRRRRPGLHGERPVDAGARAMHLARSRVGIRQSARPASRSSSASPPSASSRPASSWRCRTGSASVVAPTSSTAGASPRQETVTGTVAPAATSANSPRRRRSNSGSRSVGARRGEYRPCPNAPAKRIVRARCGPARRRAAPS